MHICVELLLVNLLSLDFSMVIEPYTVGHPNKMQY